MGGGRVKQLLQSSALHLEDDSISFCSMFAGGQTFGIDTSKIREVLGPRELQHVPMAPCFVAGIVPYRGDVLTVVSFRALLGLLPEVLETGCVLVLEDQEEKERFGLMVDSVGGVVTVDNRTHEMNPSTLDRQSRWLFAGAYKRESGLMVKLDPQRLRPSRLAEANLFDRPVTEEVG